MEDSLLRFDGFYIEVDGTSESITLDSFFILQFFPDDTVGLVYINYRIDYLPTKTEKLAYYENLMRNYDWNKESHKENIGEYTRDKKSGYIEIITIPLYKYQWYNGDFYNWTGWVKKDSLDLQSRDNFENIIQSHLFEFVAFDKNRIELE